MIVLGITDITRLVILVIMYTLWKLWWYYFYSKYLCSSTLRWVGILADVLNFWALYYKYNIMIFVAPNNRYQIAD